MSQANVKEALLATIEGIKANPSASNVVFRAETWLVEDVKCSVSIRIFDVFLSMIHQS